MKNSPSFFSVCDIPPFLDDGGRYEVDDEEEA
jgi:hypothetical protein